MTQSSERISGSFLLRAFSCVSYASREADPDVVFQAGALPEGSSEDPTEPDADTDSENADYFFRVSATPRHATPFALLPVVVSTTISGHGGY